MPTKKNNNLECSYDGNNGSEWTKEALYKHIITLMDANDKRYSDKIADLDEKNKSAIKDLKEYTNTIVVAQERAIAVAMAAADKAVGKAEMAVEKRLEGMNEFRQQMADQQKTYITRNEYDLNHKALEIKMEVFDKTISDKMEAVNKNINDREEGDNKVLHEKIEAINKTIVDKMEITDKSINEKIDALEKSINEKIETNNKSINDKIQVLVDDKTLKVGEKQGSYAVWGYIVGAIGFIIGLASIIGYIAAAIKK